MSIRPPLLPATTDAAEPVECLGLVFADDEDRRAYFVEELRLRLQDPTFRAIEGFPIGEDEDILALSDPPYYTACPNPFLPQIIAEWQAQRADLHARLGLDDSTYHREPFAADVSEGKGDPIYNAHTYHTKVPHKAIMRYILHYTEPGDLVFDGFCGTGMTGIAAQLCGDRRAVEELGLTVDASGVVYDGSQPISRLGARSTVLNDLSPAATFIAYNYNSPVSIPAFTEEARRIFDGALDSEIGWMYQTWHPSSSDPKRELARINYVVWSEVFRCPNCGAEVVYHDAAFDEDSLKVSKDFACWNCGSHLGKKSLERIFVSRLDKPLERVGQFADFRPVSINYTYGGKKVDKRPDAYDLSIIDKIDAMPLPASLCTDEMLDGERKGKDGYHLKGLTNIHHFYFPRAAQGYATVWAKCNEVESTRLSAFLRFFVQGNALGFTKMNRFSASHFSQVNRYFSGTLFVASLLSEVSPWYSYSNRLERFMRLKLPALSGAVATSCQSTTTAMGMPNDSFDYVFIDPPFGNNLHYSELNYIWESWLGVREARSSEAVMDNQLGRALVDYQALMTQAFGKVFELLKPGGWLTVEFHNSRNSVWNAIQEGILRSGFVVADIRTLDKKQRTYKQSVQKLVQQDLVISAYKPAADFTQRFELTAGSEDAAWAFVRQHLDQLPRVVRHGNVLETVAERQNFLLFDRMVAYHIQHGVAVPLSAAQFYAGLRQRFAERDGMFFLPDQLADYDRARLEAERVERLVLFVTDEKSAVTWLRTELGETPQTFQEIQPRFLQELHQARHEDLPDLRVLLEQSFLQDDAGRWYLPDPANAEDLEKLRQRDLLREFDRYAQGRGRLTSFRTEAVRAGFAHAWHERNYALIVQVAERLRDEVLQEDPDLLMYYDNASLRA